MIRLERFTESNISDLLSELNRHDIRFLYQFGGI
ncbi:GNAT family N-acetyltransferase, partial [Francisella tularensis subsp. holarctica]